MIPDTIDVFDKIEIQRLDSHRMASLDYLDIDTITGVSETVLSVLSVSVSISSIDMLGVSFFLIGTPRSMVASSLPVVEEDFLRIVNVRFCFERCGEGVDDMVDKDAGEGDVNRYWSGGDGTPCVAVGAVAGWPFTEGGNGFDGGS